MLQKHHFRVIDLDLRFKMLSSNQIYHTTLFFKFQHFKFYRLRCLYEVWNTYKLRTELCLIKFTFDPKTISFSLFSFIFYSFLNIFFSSCIWAIITKKLHLVGHPHLVVPMPVSTGTWYRLEPDIDHLTVIFL